MRYIRPGFVVVIVGATLTSISTVMVLLRYYCRHFLMRTIGVSDHLMMVALVFTWGIFVVNFYQDDTSRRYKPKWLLRPDKKAQMEVALRGSLIAWWVYRLLYNVALCFVKLSILFFYRSIAPHKTFRRLVYTTMAVTSLYTVASVFASAFQCEHPSDAWSIDGYLAQFQHTSKPVVHKCFDPIRIWVFSASINLLTDVVILLLPIPALLSLRVPMGKRLGLIGIFSVGIMAIVASSVRMWVMMLWAESPWNSARFGADLLLWGQVEINAGIISASIPFLRALFRRGKKAERVSSLRKEQISPPRPMGMDKAPEIETWALFEMENEKGIEHGLDGGEKWQPFITVPESLNSGSRITGPWDPILDHKRDLHATV